MMISKHETKMNELTASKRVLDWHMKVKLNQIKNLDKPLPEGYEGVENLIVCLEDELNELKEAYNRKWSEDSYTNVLYELADIANYCVIIANTMGKL